MNMLLKKVVVGAALASSLLMGANTARADLLEVIMKDMPGVKVKRMDIPFQGILPGLSAKKFDYIVTSVTATKERNEHYALSVPVADATVAMLLPDRLRPDQGHRPACRKTWRQGQDQGQGIRGF